MSASFKDEDSTQLFKNCRKIWKCCDKIFSGGRISDSRVCKLFCTTRRRKREERLSLKTKTAGNSAQNLTDFLIISGFTRNPAHWPSHRVHWTSGAVLLMVLKPNPIPLESELLHLIVSSIEAGGSDHWHVSGVFIESENGAPVIYWQPRQLDRPADGSGTKRLK